MDKQYINIAIAGLSIHESNELKNQLCNILPQHFEIQWKTITDLNINCLFIHEFFFETEGAQRIINTKKFPWLKIARNQNYSGHIENNTLYFPLHNGSQDLNQWLNQNLYPLINEHIYDINHDVLLEKIDISQFNELYFKTMLNQENHHKLHLSDHLGTIAVIDLIQNIAWCNPHHPPLTTNFSFSYDLASTSDLVKVSRKSSYILHDWLWNLFWCAPNFYQCIPEDGHYKISFWPKPYTNENHKSILQLSACFIQGAKISTISEQYEIPINIIRQFLAANMAAGNLSKISAWDTHYQPPKNEDKKDESFIKSFLGKIRLKFGF